MVRWVSTNVGKGNSVEKGQSVPYVGLEKLDIYNSIDKSFNKWTLMYNSHYMQN